MVGRVAFGSRTDGAMQHIGWGSCPHSPHPPPPHPLCPTPHPPIQTMGIYANGTKSGLNKPGERSRQKQEKRAAAAAEAAAAEAARQAAAKAKATAKAEAVAIKEEAGSVWGWCVWGVVGGGFGVGGRVRGPSFSGFPPGT